MNAGMTRSRANSTPKSTAAKGETAEQPPVETAVQPEPGPKDLPVLPDAEPEVAEDGMSIKMPEGHTVHLEKPHPSVDPNLRITADGEVLTSADDQ